MIRKTLKYCFVLMLLVCMSITAFNTDIAFASTKSGTCGTNLTWTLKDGNLTISGTGHYIKENAFRSKKNITSVTIPEGVTKIGKAAFSGCDNLTSVTIPDSVTYIGEKAFQCCGNLTKVTIPNSVTKIRNATFSGCSSLTKVTIPDGVTVIANYTFSGCSSLTRVTIPDSVTEIGPGAFRHCSSLTRVTIPDGVVTIAQELFEFCSSLTKVTIPDSATKIVNYAFVGCSSLTSVTIPNSVTNIEWLAFDSDASFTINCGKYSHAYQYAETAGLSYNIVFPEDDLDDPWITIISNKSKGLQLQWVEVPYASGYYVYRGSKKIKTITSGSTHTYTDTTAKSNGTKYTYKVCAFRKSSGGIVRSKFSPKYSCYALTRPTITSLKNSSANTIKVTWTKNNLATGYAITYVTGSDRRTKWVKGASTTSTTIQNLEIGKTYKVYVHAYKASNSKSNWSAESAKSAVKNIKITK